MYGNMRFLKPLFFNKGFAKQRIILILRLIMPCLQWYDDCKPTNMLVYMSIYYS